MYLLQSASDHVRLPVWRRRGRRVCGYLLRAWDKAAATLGLRPPPQPIAAAIICHGWSSTARSRGKRPPICAPLSLLARAVGLPMGLMPLRRRCFGATSTVHAPVGVHSGLPVGDKLAPQVRLFTLVDCGEETLGDGRRWSLPHLRWHCDEQDAVNLGTPPHRGPSSKDSKPD